ncbi:MAG: hypothetical protein U9O87_11050 [Verrucomicrobiota bacterium]|nr:hypothetical protein [Verrucomicrobiota bacterium]
MKRFIVVVLSVCLSFNVLGGWFGTYPEETKIKGWELKGEISGDNIVFSLNFDVSVAPDEMKIPLVSGDVAFIDLETSGKYDLEKEKGSFAISYKYPGEYNVSFRFASRVKAKEKWRETTFSVPSSDIRKVMIMKDKDDVELDLPNVLNLKNKKVGKTNLTSALLGAENIFILRWKPRIEELKSELTMGVELNTVAQASAGVMKFTSFLNYNIIQGELQKIAVEIPDKLNITQVDGENIISWDIAKENEKRILTVILNRPENKLYKLKIIADSSLQKFPCEFAMPAIVPRDVMRSNGFLAVGTDSAIKFSVIKKRGVNQIDLSAFPGKIIASVNKFPKRNVFAFNYSSVPYALTVKIDDIVTSLFADTKIYMKVQEEAVEVTVSAEVDIRDASIRELSFNICNELMVTDVTGAGVSDYNIEEKDGQKKIKLFFSRPLIGRVVFNLKMEYKVKDWGSSVKLPKISLDGTETERGYLVLAADESWTIELTEFSGLREIHTGSVPFKSPNVLLAYRYKDNQWSGELQVKRKPGSIYADMLHLISLGEGVVYGSSVISYHTSGAPVDEFTLKIPENYKNIEFSGRAIRSWDKNLDKYKVSLHEKISGDYTLLVLYEFPFKLSEKPISIAEIESVNTETETGFVAITGASGMRLETGELSKSVFPLPADQIPPSYKVIITNPILQAYKYVNLPHNITVKLSAYDSCKFPGAVIEHSRIETKINTDGEIVTNASYWVKNSRMQHLTVKLPDGASLWEVKVDKNPVRPSVSSGELLIPVQRRPDPNIPIEVKILYAEKTEKLGKSRKVLLKAPRMPAESVFAEWQLTVPEEYVLKNIGGSIPLSGKYREKQPITTQTLFWKIAKRFFGKPEAIISLLLVAFSFWILIYSYTAKKMRILLTALFGTLLILGILGTLASASNNTFHRFIPREKTQLYTLHFSRPVSFSDNELVVTGELVKESDNKNMPFAVTGAGLALCGIIMCFLKLRKKTFFSILLFMASGFCFTTFSTNLASFYATGALLIIPFFVIVGVGRRLRKRIKLSNSTVSVALMLVFMFVGVNGYSEETDLKFAAFESVNYNIDVRLSEDEKSVLVKMKCNLKSEQAEEKFLLTPQNAVLKDILLPDKNVKLKMTEEGAYYIMAEKVGTYYLEIDFFLSLKQDDNGVLYLNVPMAETPVHTVKINIPKKNIDVFSRGAVMLKAKEVANVTEVELLYGNSRNIDLNWRPKTRKIENEETVFFCATESMILFNEGVGELEHLINCRISRGKIRKIELRIPQNQTVISVNAKHLYTWSFDKEKSTLEILFDEPMIGKCLLKIATQVAVATMPDEVTLGIPQIIGASRQRGIMAVSSVPSVKISASPVKNLNPISSSDFPLSHFPKKQRILGSVAGMIFSYRYYALPAEIKIEVSEVKPEIRVIQDSKFRIGDERTIFNTSLNIEISKAGLFQLKLNIPENYEIDSLSGGDVSHWDEYEDDGHYVLIYFKGKKLGNISLHLSLALNDKSSSQILYVPRVNLEKEIKHTGILLVSAEKGIRLTVKERSGITETSASALGYRVRDALAFNILHSDWSLKLQKETVTPWVQTEVLQKAHITDGMISNSIYIRYKIENAGIKMLKIKLHDSLSGVDISGDDIVGYSGENGIWKVELHDKVEREYLLKIQYQSPFDKDFGEVAVNSVKPLGVSLIKGYVSLFADSGLRVSILSKKGYLKHFDARSIPPIFGVGSLSDSTHSFRTVSGDYSITVGVKRHKSAELLPARVKKVKINSIVAENGAQFYKIKIALIPGSKRFLKMIMPEKSKLWSVFVDGLSVVTSIENKSILIPLEISQQGTSLRNVEVYYVTPADTEWNMEKQLFYGPEFDLPLQNIEWKLFLPKNKKYTKQDGTLKYVEEKTSLFANWNLNKYESYRQSSMQTSKNEAVMLLDKGSQLAIQGEQEQAKQMLQQAMNTSGAEKALNEDARVQYRNLQRQQTMVGLMKRRNELISTNIMPQKNEKKQIIISEQQFNKGDFSNALVRKVQDSMTSDEKKALGQLADRLLDQQNAALSKIRLLHISFPEQGKIMRFKRDMQISPNEEMKVSFNVKDKTDKTNKSFAGNKRLFLFIFLLFSSTWIMFGNKKQTSNTIIK